MIRSLINTSLFSAMLFGLLACSPPASTTSAASPLTIEKFAAYTERFDKQTQLTQSHATGHVGDVFFTHWKDGGEASLTLNDAGEFAISWIGGDYNYVGGPGWHYGDKNRVIGYNLSEETGASYLTLYGWGYNKDMPKTDPNHLVEYYVIQRWSREAGQGGEKGKTFVSNGVEYTTYRTIRREKPSINNTATFYQYWSVPAAPMSLGEDHLIIFADHVKAWEETGWYLPDLNNFDASDDPTYQVLAVEVFIVDNDGSAAGRVWDASQK